MIEDSEISNFVIAPSNIYLSTLLSDKYDLCAQNAHYLDFGAFTGEVSFKQLKSMGIKYALIGHSERRAMFNETDESVNKKLHKCNQFLQFCLFIIIIFINLALIIFL